MGRWRAVASGAQPSGRAVPCPLRAPCATGPRLHGKEVGCAGLRRFVDGQEVELDPPAATVSRLSDRLLVRGPDGTHSAVAVKSGDSVWVSYKGHVYEVQQARPRTRTAS